MPTRTVRFIGVAHSSNPTINVTMDFNGTTVFDGPVPAAPTMPSTTLWTDHAQVLFTFPLDTSVSGNVPLSIFVEGGELVFINLYANYVQHYRNQLEEFLPHEYFGPMNQHTDDDDGRTDIRIDGRPRQRNWSPTSFDAMRPGDWCWYIFDDSLFTCQFRISELCVDPLPALPVVENPQTPPNPTYVPKPLHPNQKP